MTAKSSRPFRLAVEGCGHGTLKAIYDAVTRSCQEKGWANVDLLIIGGDFQAVRNAADLNAMAVPVKYREIGDFHEYYSGKVVAPYLTIFIGGNHEASNYMRELYYGGWAAPNIYYLGAANVIRLGSLRIAGMSGIWKGYDYKSTHFERLPYNSDDVRSIFHTRELDVRKLLQISTQVDVGLSHDWPAGVEWLGDHSQLFRQKSFFEQDARAGQLGSRAARYVLDHLRPPYWFSAHLHVKYAAAVDHARGKQNNQRQDQGLELKRDARPAVLNEDEIELEDNLDMSSSAAKLGFSPQMPGSIDEALRAQLPGSFRKLSSPATQAEPPTTITNPTTHFLALDKCLPRRDFLQLLEVQIPGKEAVISETGKLQLSYDPEWLAITKVFADDIKIGNPGAKTTQDLGKAHYSTLIKEAQVWVANHVEKADALTIPDNFSVTAPVHSYTDNIKAPPRPREYSNPQTEAFCKLLGIGNPFFITEEESQQRMNLAPRPEKERFRPEGSRGRSGGGRGGFRGGGRGGFRGAMRGGYQGRPN